MSRNQRLVYQYGQVRALFQIGDFLYPHMMEGARELCGISFIRALLSFMSMSSCDLITFQRPHLLKRSHWALRFQHVNLGDTQAFRPWQ